MSYEYWFCHNCDEEISASHVSLNGMCRTCGHHAERVDINKPDYKTKAETHPNLYKYCMEKLGLKDIIEYVDTKGKKEIYTDNDITEYL